MWSTPGRVDPADAGRPALAGKVATVSMVGNEDGGHEVVADVFQGLNEVGYSVPKNE